MKTLAAAPKRIYRRELTHTPSKPRQKPNEHEERWSRINEPTTTTAAAAVITTTTRNSYTKQIAMRRKFNVPLRWQRIKRIDKNSSIRVLPIFYFYHVVVTRLSPTVTHNLCSACSVGPLFSSHCSTCWHTDTAALPRDNIRHLLANNKHSFSSGVCWHCVRRYPTIWTDDNDDIIIITQTHTQSAVHCIFKWENFPLSLLLDDDGK